MTPSLEKHPGNGHAGLLLDFGILIYIGFLWKKQGVCSCGKGCEIGRNAEGNEYVFFHGLLKWALWGRINPDRMVRIGP
jgi:hypothetical protein